QRGAILIEGHGEADRRRSEKEDHDLLRVFVVGHVDSGGDKDANHDDRAQEDGRRERRGIPSPNDSTACVGAERHDDAERGDRIDHDVLLRLLAASAWELKPATQIPSTALTTSVITIATPLATKTSVRPIRPTVIGMKKKAR